MEKKKEKIFRFGDKVYHHKYGWGEVKAATDKIVGVLFEHGNREFTGEDLQLLSFSYYSIELIGFSQEQPERKVTWHSIWEDYCDEGYLGAHHFIYYLAEKYKLPETI